MKTKNILPVVLSLFLGLALTACNTVDGFGQDIERAGDSLEDAAN